MSLGPNLMVTEGNVFFWGDKDTTSDVPHLDISEGRHFRGPRN